MGHVKLPLSLISRTRKKNLLLSSSYGRWNNVQIGLRLKKKLLAVECETE